MNKQGRSEQGRFLSKSEDTRQVRSIRLTDNVWDKLGELASNRSITRADLIEEWFQDGSFIYETRINELEVQLKECKDWDIEKLNKIASERCITLNELINDLLLRSKKSKSSIPKSSENNFTKETLEKLRDEALNNLPVSPKTSTYKRAKEALTYFIKLLGVV